MAEYAAGWYPDYTDARQQRYWDGQQWTHYVHRPVAEGAPRWRRGKQPKFRPSAQLVEATYRMVFADRSMIALVFAGTVLSTLAAAAVVLPPLHGLHFDPGYRQDVESALIVSAGAGAA